MSAAPDSTRADVLKELKAWKKVARSSQGESLEMLQMKQAAEEQVQKCQSKLDLCTPAAKLVELKEKRVETLEGKLIAAKAWVDKC